MLEFSALFDIIEKKNGRRKKVQTNADTRSNLHCVPNGFLCQMIKLCGMHRMKSIAQYLIFIPLLNRIKIVPKQSDQASKA